MAKILKEESERVLRFDVLVQTINMIDRDTTIIIENAVDVSIIDGKDPILRISTEGAAYYYPTRLVTEWQVKYKRGEWNAI